MSWEKNPALGKQRGGGFEEKIICFIFNHIPGLSDLVDSAGGGKYVILSDNRQRKPRDRCIYLRDVVQCSQLALPGTLGKVNI